MKRLLTLSTLLLLSIVTFAQTEVDGIYYEFSGTEATVVSGTNKYTGSVTIPASVNYGGETYSVTSIGSYAFNGCSSLTSITIPNSVTSIGIQAFYNTAWYNNLPDGLVYAGKVAYKYKGTMPENTSITIKDGTLGIAGAAFQGCTGLTSVTIPNSVTSIGSYAFNGCSSLTSITIPNSVTSIGGAAFWNCI